MNKVLLIINTLLIISSCKNDEEINEYGVAILDSVKAQKSSDDFVKFYYPLLKFGEEFTSLSQSNKVISKSEFFDSLLTGNFLPLKQRNKQDYFYRLIKFRKDIDPSIPETIKSLAYYANANMKMENQLFPSFSFIDLDGNSYNNLKIKNKIVVLKCWFINCQRCVEEMPMLNKLVMKYSNRQDILFLSLAFDKKENLDKFLKKIEFKYKVIPDQKDFVMSKLNVRSFPTHFIIDKEGKIVKVTGSVDYIERNLLKLL